MGFKSAWVASNQRGWLQLGMGRVWSWGVGGRRRSSMLVASRGLGSDRRQRSRSEWVALDRCGTMGG